MEITNLPDFLETSLKDTKSKKISKIDFLESLLKNIDDKTELKDIINHSNLSKEQKDKLIEKFLSKLENKDNLKLDFDTNDKNEKKIINTDITNNKLIKNFSKKIADNNIKNTIISEINNKKIKNIPVNNNSKKPLPKSPTIEELLKSNKKIDKEKTSFNNEELNILSNIQTQIKNIPSKEEKEIVKKVKTIIIQKSINNPVLKQIIKTDEFKNISSFKDLMKLSQKLNLNLVKIAISKENIKSNNIPHSIKTPNNLNLSSNTSKIKNVSINPINIKKEENSKTSPNKETNKLSLNDLLQTNNKTENIKTEKNQDKKIINSSFLKTAKNNSKDIFSDTKPEHSKNNDNPNPISSMPIQNEFKNQIISAKQTLKHFASNLKEAVENYKPPVSKLTLELNPQNLGKVEVTIKHRGDNLSVQINTNNISTINFLTSTQQELKNSLINMGFTNINMSFNSNQDNQQKQNQPQSKYSKNDKNNEDEELVIDFSYKYA